VIDAAPRPFWVPAAISAVAVVLLTATMPEDWTERERPIAARVAAIAAGQPDASGRLRPLLVHDEGERWLQPLAVYPGAILRTIGLPEKVAARLPSVVAASASAVLAYLLAMYVFGDVRWAALAAALLMASPAWLSFGRAAGGDLLVVPAMLGWLVAVLECRLRPRLAVAALGGLALGLGAWAQPAGVIAVPVHLAIGIWLLQPRARGEWRLAAVAAGAALVPFLAYAVWFLRHPDSVLDTFGRWLIHPAHLRSPWDGLVAATNWDVMARRAGLYWSYLSPTFLFDGRAMFTAALAIPLVVGAWVGGRTTRVHTWLLCTFLAAPVGAVLLDVGRDAALVLTMAPLGALLAARGVEQLSGWPRLRFVAWVLVAAALAGGVLTS
jgi:4-amino-4-deoxy-L-arabinose transferase-like glycosyltransferase